MFINFINLNYFMQSKQSKIQAQINQLISCVHKNVSEELKYKIQSFSKKILSVETGRPNKQTIPQLKQKITIKVTNNNDQRSVLHCQDLMQRFLNNNCIVKKSQVFRMLLKLSEINNKNEENFSNLFREGRKKQLNTTVETNLSTMINSLPVAKKNNQNLQQIRMIRNRGSVEDGVTQSDLVRQLSFVFTNTNSNQIVQTNEGYQIKNSLNVSETVRKMINEMSDLGWLHKKIVKSSEKDGTVRKSLRLAIQEELNEYYRWIGIIENIAKDGKLTLRKLFTWAFHPQELLKWLAIIIESVEAFEGSHIISIVNSYRPNGLNQIHKLINRLLSHLLKPLLHYIESWVYFGELLDSKNEFFILENKKVSESEEWGERFKLVYENIPNILNIQSAKMIFITGKAIYFLRNKCKNVYQVKTPFIDINNIFDINSLQGSNTLVSLKFMTWLNSIHKQVNQALVQVMFNQFNLKYHLESMKNFFLVGKGDFIQHLYDNLKDKLSLKKYQITEHFIDGHIYDSLNKCFTDFKLPDKVNYYQDAIVRRLLAKKIEMSNINSTEAWDCFNFQYSLQKIQPLQNIFSPELMHNYQKIFSFLWKVKQIEQILKSLWINQSRTQSVKMRQTRIKELHMLFHFSYLLRNTMSHFITNLSSYLMITIETSWKKFWEQIDKAKNFDDILKQHKEFQQEILEITLNTPKGKNIQVALNNIFSVINNFKNTFLRLQECFNEYYDKLMLYQSRQEMAQRGIVMSQSLEIPEFNSGKLSNTIHEVKNCFDTSFKNLFNQIRKEGQTKLNILCFKLDFSEYYSNLYIE